MLLAMLYPLLTARKIYLSAEQLRRYYESFLSGSGDTKDESMDIGRGGSETNNIPLFGLRIAFGIFDQLRGS
jgi:hypothetical protein